MTSEHIIEALRASDEVYREDKGGIAERAADVWARGNLPSGRVRRIVIPFNRRCLISFSTS